MCAALRRYRSQLPSPLLRSGCADRKKIRPISATGGPNRHRIPFGVLSITTKSPYALRALSELAAMGGDSPVPIAELARRRDVPVQFLEQLFATLRRAGLLKSQRGVKGGYSFARPASEIPVLE